MEVLVATHGSSLKHDTGERHPERPERVEAVHRGVVGSGLEVIEIQAPQIQSSELEMAHDPSYIEMIEAYCSLGGGALDMDTIASEATWEAALTAAGAVRVLTEELRERTDSTGFAITRPPGHHAFRDRATGFCIFNNLAVTAALLRSNGERVAILDWDVHHGNGTQSILGDDPGTLYVSIHQDHFYPFDGDVADIDAGEAKGTNVNIPLPAWTGGDVYRRAWGELVIPVVSQFEPDWVLISSGYDAHVDYRLALWTRRRWPLHATGQSKIRNLSYYGPYAVRISSSLRRKAPLNPAPSLPITIWEQIGKGRWSSTLTRSFSAQSRWGHLTFI